MSGPVIQHGIRGRKESRVDAEILANADGIRREGRREDRGATRAQVKIEGVQFTRAEFAG